MLIHKVGAHGFPLFRFGEKFIVFIFGERSEAVPFCFKLVDVVRVEVFGDDDVLVTEVIEGFFPRFHRLDSRYWDGEGFWYWVFFVCLECPFVFACVAFCDVEVFSCVVVCCVFFDDVEVGAHNVFLSVVFSWYEYTKLVASMDS